MAPPTIIGTSYITLEGDQIQFTRNFAQDKSAKDEKILLNGSHFKDVFPVATLALSALYLLAFLVILWEYLKRRGRHNSEVDKSKKTKYSVGTAMGFMILFFATDLANRVYHERETLVSVFYVAINIPLGCFATIADGLLLVYLWKNSPIKIKRHGSPPSYAMTFAFFMYWILGIVTKGAQIWNVVTQFTPNITQTGCNGGDNEDCKISNGIELSLKIEQDLASAATGMLLLFSIGYALFSVGFVRRLIGMPESRKRLALSVSVLAGTFLARSIVSFAFTLIYAQFDHFASLGIQLVYLVVWGLLSVCLYTSVVFIEAARKKGEFAIVEQSYESPQAGDAPGWTEKQPQVHVTDQYPDAYHAPPYYYGEAKVPPASGGPIF